MFQAVYIDGEAYWDGGYVGNPTITPLVRESDAQDSILVQINPRERPARRDPPATALIAETVDAAPTPRPCPL